MSAAQQTGVEMLLAYLEEPRSDAERILDQVVIPTEDTIERADAAPDEHPPATTTTMTPGYVARCVELAGLPEERVQEYFGGSKPLVRHGVVIGEYIYILPFCTTCNEAVRGGRAGAEENALCMRRGRATGARRSAQIGRGARQAVLIAPA